MVQVTLKEAKANKPIECIKMSVNAQYYPHPCTNNIFVYRRLQCQIGSSYEASMLSAPDATV